MMVYVCAGQDSRPQSPWSCYVYLPIDLGSTSPSLAQAPSQHQDFVLDVNPKQSLSHPSDIKIIPLEDLAKSYCVWFGLGGPEVDNRQGHLLTLLRTRNPSSEG